jgi:Arrestin (or S-antigen), N-terminal domain/Arrestin (or S-antigen), C-terminal domain
MIRDHIDAVF